MSTAVTTRPPDDTELPARDLEEVFGITVHSQNGRSVLELSGGLDLATAPLFAEALGCLCGNSPHTITVQLADLAFCDCAGLTALVTAHRDQGAHGYRLVLSDPSPKVRRLLALTRLDGYFDVC